jgi:integrase
MLTVVRSGAAALARRKWIDGCSIRFPGSTLGLKRKTDRRDQDHRVAFSEWAWDQIAPVIEDESTLLFSEGQAPIRPARVLPALRAQSGISNWEWHDFRRSFRSWAAKNVVQADAAETVLGHTIHRDEVAKAYQRHKFEDEAEVAFHRWQAHIQQLTGGEDAGNILPMRLPNKK